MENDKNKSENYNLKPQKSSLLKNILSLILLVGVIACLFLLTTTSGRKEIGEAQFKEDITSGKIEKVNFTSNYIEIYYKEESGGTVYYMGPGLSDSVNQIIDEYNDTAPIKVDKISPIISSFSWSYVIFPIIMIGGAMLVIIFFTRQLGRTNNQSMDFVKNRAKIDIITVLSCYFIT